jgi:hypothetical protein
MVCWAARCRLRLAKEVAFHCEWYAHPESFHSVCTPIVEGRAFIVAGVVSLHILRWNVSLLVHGCRSRFWVAKEQRNIQRASTVRPHLSGTINLLDRLQAIIKAQCQFGSLPQSYYKELVGLRWFVVRSSHYLLFTIQ